jgi:zinc transporter ZupT
MAVGAGLLLGTAFLDLMPEALSIARQTGQQPTVVLGLALLSFLSFLLIDSILDRIGHGRDEPVVRKTLGRVSGGLLILHSLRDGMVIGAAYSASRSAGLIVAFGIVAHDIGDGMNTILLCTEGDNARIWDYLFLVGDALAPLVGGLVTIWWVQSPANAVVLLSIASGFFLQMATSDFLPDLRKYASTQWFVIPAVLSGVGLIYVANLLMADLSR